MDEKTYAITLADGTALTGLRLNGNNYIPDAEIAPAMFAGNCSPVVISDGENEETHDNMKLIQITHVDEEYWFVLLDVPESELRRLKMQSDLEYLAMMTGVEL